MKVHGVLVFGTFLIVSPAGAQGIRPLTFPPEKPTVNQETKIDQGKKPEERGEAKVVSSECGVFLWTDPQRRWLESSTAAANATAASLERCLRTDYEAAPSNDEVLTANALTLVKRHVNYKKYKRWVNAAVADINKLNSTGMQETRTKVIALRDLVGQLGDKVHEALNRKGFNDPLTAMLFTGASFADAGSNAAEDGETPGGAKKPEGAPLGPSAFIAFESPHFGDDGHFPVHVAFGGRIGFQQIMTIVKPLTEESGAEPVDQSLVGDYKDGLVWSVGATAYGLSTGRSEAFVRLSIGGSRIGDTRSVLTGENGEGFIGVPVNADASISAPRWEIGLGWNYYGRPMEVAHLEKGLLNPAFSAYVMQRRDRRFEAEGVLAAFDNPERRWIYGISVNLRNLVRSDGGEVQPSRANTFDFGFSIEHEFARGSGLKIPNSTRYLLRGEINLLRALAGASGEEKKAAGAGGGETTEK